jgi:hypothetical protein
MNWESDDDTNYKYCSIPLTKPDKEGRWVNLEDIDRIYYHDHDHGMSCGCNVEFKIGKEMR